MDAEFDGASAAIAYDEDRLAGMVPRVAGGEGVQSRQLVHQAKVHQPLQRPVDGGGCRDALVPEQVQKLVSAEGMVGLAQAFQHRALVSGQTVESW